MKKLQNNYDAFINRIIQDIYDGAANLGFVSDHIPAGLHTADFDLPNDQKVRIKEEKNGVYYSIFRAK